MFKNIETCNISFILQLWLVTYNNGLFNFELAIREAPIYRLQVYYIVYSGNSLLSHRLTRHVG